MAGLDKFPGLVHEFLSGLQGNPALLVSRCRYDIVLFLAAMEPGVAPQTSLVLSHNVVESIGASAQRDRMKGLTSLHIDLHDKALKPIIKAPNCISYEGVQQQ